MAITGVADSYANYYMNQTGKANAENATRKEKENSVLNQMQDKYSDTEITSGTFSQSQISKKAKGFKALW